MPPALLHSQSEDNHSNSDEDSSDDGSDDDSHQDTMARGDEDGFTNKARTEFRKTGNMANLCSVMRESVVEGMGSDNIIILHGLTKVAQLPIVPLHPKGHPLSLSSMEDYIRGLGMTPYVLGHGRGEEHRSYVRDVVHAGRRRDWNPAHLPSVLYFIGYAEDKGEDMGQYMSFASAWAGWREVCMPPNALWSNAIPLTARTEALRNAYNVYASLEPTPDKSAREDFKAVMAAAGIWRYKADPLPEGSSKQSQDSVEADIEYARNCGRRLQWRALRNPKPDEAVIKELCAVVSAARQPTDAVPGGSPGGGGAPTGGAGREGSQPGGSARRGEGEDSADAITTSPVVGERLYNNRRKMCATVTYTPDPPHGPAPIFIVRYDNGTRGECAFMEGDKTWSPARADPPRPTPVDGPQDVPRVGEKVCFYDRDNVTGTDYGRITENEGSRQFIHFDDGSACYVSLCLGNWSKQKAPSPLRGASGTTNAELPGRTATTTPLKTAESPALDDNGRQVRFADYGGDVVRKMLETQQVADRHATCPGLQFNGADTNAIDEELGRGDLLRFVLDFVKNRRYNSDVDQVALAQVSAELARVYPRPRSDSVPFVGRRVLCRIHPAGRGWRRTDSPTFPSTSCPPNRKRSLRNSDSSATKCVMPAGTNSSASTKGPLPGS